ncbi:hypothetical protein ACUXAV_002109 [Cupriavidus metallidurans]|jgi:hypothetical protein|uniref:hypothetical protein n=1 Tax=Cupriavidus TaxID=106589 RepID=UPI000493922B|nr:hypothetical protein [Cupriavidus metallidurans]KWW35560.1 hypothetical protein AU374_03627 [Cupriavidus metallidurans]MDE4921698.1 hypothetical protein [Cupriavidus metallidurans]
MSDATSEPCETCRTNLRLRAALLGSGQLTGFCRHAGLLVTVDVAGQEVTGWTWRPASKQEAAGAILHELQVVDAVAERANVSTLQ